MPSACLREEVAHGKVEVQGWSQALAVGQLASVNGSYGMGCVDRASTWSAEIMMGAPLTAPRLSVLMNNSTCVLTLTELRTLSQVLTASPPMALTTVYKISPSAFAGTSPFLANARLSAATFADDFVITVLYPGEPAFDTALNQAVAIPPTVDANTPPMAAINRSIATKPTATFSVTMDPLTISAVTFTLDQQGTPVPGVVTYDVPSKVATFSPDDVLGLDLLYTATVTTGARDTGDTPLAASHVWTFRTAEVSQAPVDLGTAAAFAVLASAAVSNVGATSVTGEVGSATGVADFPPGTIIGGGSVHVADATVNQAMSDLTVAYNDAAGRSLNPIPVGASIGTMTFTPGLYRAATSLAVASGSVTLDAQLDPAAVFIFQIGTSWDMSAGTEIVLVNGADVSNIYFQVGSSATLGTNAVFRGTILADQSITLGMGADVYGRVLARDAAISLSLNTIVRPTP
jgi:hypothetical protein